MLSLTRAAESWAVERRGAKPTNLQLERTSRPAVERRPSVAKRRLSGVERSRPAWPGQGHA